ncbi:hypothetical protein GYMLUDRAFT_37937 [Collybiopsis luxurians FD-317 M1]|nr:hypothetical protein GYMLUDRAFT_37937 [Collybiopsis luxurians FD-317 M1]
MSAIQARSLKRKKPPACDYCKARRVLCHPQPDGPCPRCVEKGVNCTTTPVVRRKRRTKAEILASESHRVQTSSSSTPASSASISTPSTGREESAAVILYSRHSATNILGEPLPVPPTLELPPEIVQELFETFRDSHYNVHLFLRRSKLEESLRLNSWDPLRLHPQDRVLVHCIITVASLFSANSFILGNAQVTPEHIDIFSSNAPLKASVVPDLRPYGLRREPLVRQLWAEAIWLGNQEGITTNPSRENAASCWLLGHLSYMMLGNGSSPYQCASAHHMKFLVENQRFDASPLSLHGHMLIDAVGALLSGKSISFSSNEERFLVPVHQPETLEQLISSCSASSWTTSDAFMSVHAFAHHYLHLARETLENLTGAFARSQPLNEGFLIKHFASLDLFHTFLVAGLDQIARLRQQLESRINGSEPPLPPPLQLFHLRSFRHGVVIAWSSLILTVYELVRDRSVHFTLSPSSNNSTTGYINSTTAADRFRERMQMHHNLARSLMARTAVELCEVLRDSPNPLRFTYRGDLAKWARFLMEENLNVVNVNGMISRVQCSQALECFRDALLMSGFSYADENGIVESINEHLASCFVDDLLTQMEMGSTGAGGGSSVLGMPYISTWT